MEGHYFDIQGKNNSYFLMILLIATTESLFSSLYVLPKDIKFVEMIKHTSLSSIDTIMIQDNNSNANILLEITNKNDNISRWIKFKVI